MTTNLNEYSDNTCHSAADMVLNICKEEVNTLAKYNIDSNNPLDLFELGESSYGDTLKRILKIKEEHSDWTKWVSDYLKTDRKNYLSRFNFWADGRCGRPNMFITVDTTDLVVVLGHKHSQALILDAFNPTEANWVPIKNLVPVFLDSNHKVTTKQMNAFKNAVSPSIKKIQETFGKSITNSGTVEHTPTQKTEWASTKFTNTESNEYKEESEDMKKSFTKGMFQTNKDALKQVGYLNAGRASNKVLKEAVSPFIRMAFKPSFMQRMVMKMLKIQDPAEKLLQSEYSDVVCSQLAQAIIELKGVEDEHVREVTKAGIVYSSLKLSEKIPFEEMMDKAVDKITEQSESVFKKIKESK